MNKALLKYEDKLYRKHQLKIIKTNYEIIGIRMPTLRQIAQNKKKIKLNNFKTFEELMISALAISYLKDFNEIKPKLNKILKYVDNWSIIDSMASSFKIFKKEQKQGYDLIKKLLNSNEPFTIRLGLVLLLNYYINDQYINKVFKHIKEINNKHYYVMMANSWLICECFVFYPNLTIKILNQVDETTRKKAISKINDSFRVTKEQKEIVRNYR